MIRKIRNKKVLLFWVMVIAVLVLIALFPGLFASHDPVQADLCLLYTSGISVKHFMDMNAEGSQ